MKKLQKGFTLIELVIVIVILGILAVTAAPKFLNLQDDARHATLKGLAGAINSALPIVYSKAAVNGKEKLATTSLDDLNLKYGYPVATESSLSQAVDGFNNGDWSFIAEADQCSNLLPGISCSIITSKNHSDFSTIELDETCMVMYIEANETFPAKAYLLGSECDGMSFTDIIINYSSET